MKGFQKLKKNKLKIFYFTVLLLVFSIFLILAYLNIQVKNQIAEVSVNSFPLTFASEEYPVVEGSPVPQISAQGAVVIDKDSKVPVYSKNPKLRFLPASTTKIMTALVALEFYKPQDVLTIYKKNVGGAISDFELGEQFRFEDMLYAMLLPSNNDATASIAQNYPGGERAFIARMNEKAKEISLTNTHYVDPVGLEIGNYTTPEDLARLTSIAIENPAFSKIVSTKNKEISNTEGTKYFIYNLNELLDLPGINGVKTGYTKEAGEILVTSKYLEEINKNLIIVVMKSEDRFLDTQILLEYLKNITYQPIHL